MKRVCSTPGCSAITDHPKCPQCRRKADRARGTRQTRGYDAAHQARRLSAQQRMEAGEQVMCTNPYCLTPDRPIGKGELHQGHNPDRTDRGPEHRDCNLHEAGLAAHGLTPGP